MATRKEIAEAFIAAKALTALDGTGCVWPEWNGKGKTGRFEFICSALDAVKLPGAEEATAIISNRFGSTIFSWLYSKGILNTQMTDDNVQAYKHRWLDSVIKEFSS